MDTVNQDNHLFDYIISCWFGFRRSGIHTNITNNYKYHFIEKHLEFLENDLPINNVYFVVNGDCDYNKVMQVIRGFSVNYPIEVIVRENRDYSYGAWDRAIRHALQDNTVAQYGFLCEDDYIPATKHFYKPFYNKFTDDVGYVTSWFENKHCAISNGFIKYEKLNKEQPFTLTNADTYQAAERNQKYFLKQYDWQIEDVSEHELPFYDKNVGLLKYGGDKEVLIEPIL